MRSWSAPGRFRKTTHSSRPVPPARERQRGSSSTRKPASPSRRNSCGPCPRHRSLVAASTDCACGKRPSAPETRRSRAATSGLKSGQALTSTASWLNLAAASSRMFYSKAAAASSVRSLTAETSMKSTSSSRPRLWAEPARPRRSPVRGPHRSESVFALDSMAVEQIGNDVYLRGRRRSIHG